MEFLTIDDGIKVYFYQKLYHNYLQSFYGIIFPKNVFQLVAATKFFSTKQFGDKFNCIQKL